jgi:hypothetical protein
MNLRRACFVLTASLLAPACSGNCGSSSGSGGSAAAAPSGSSVSADLSGRDALAPRARRGRPGRHGGLLGLLFRAGHEAGLSDAQKSAVADIQDKLQDEEPKLTAIGDFQTDLVAGIRAGALDKMKLEGDYALVDNGIAARQAREGEALDALYAALDRPARTALVTTVRARLGAMFRPRPDLVDGGLTDAGEPAWLSRRVSRVKAELTLDDAQTAKAATLLSKIGISPAATEALKDLVHKHAEEVITAFAADSFDAKKLDLTPAGGKAPPLAALRRETDFMGQLLPLLTPEQREKLATARLRRVLARWTEDTEPWSPVEEALEPIGPR